jgi:hypothetical protein
MQLVHAVKINKAVRGGGCQTDKNAILSLYKYTKEDMAKARAVI